MLRSALRYLVSDGVEQLFCPIFKGLLGLLNSWRCNRQVVLKRWYMATNMYMLHNIQEERISQITLAIEL